MARAVQFGEWAENPASVARLKAIAIDYGIDISDSADGGYDDDSE